MNKYLLLVILTFSFIAALGQSLAPRMDLRPFGFVGPDSGNSLLATYSSSS